MHLVGEWREGSQIIQPISNSVTHWLWVAVVGDIIDKNNASAHFVMKNHQGNLLYCQMFDSAAKDLGWIL